MKDVKKKNVELILSRIVELEILNSINENYEDCQRIVNSKTSLKMFINDKIDYDTIKDDVEFLNSKLSEILPKGLKSSNE